MEENPWISKRAIAEHFNFLELTFRETFKNWEFETVAHREREIHSKKRKRIQVEKFYKF